MEQTILIEKAELGHRVDLLTHYHAQGEKRKDLNADIGETSFDDEELLDTFLLKAVNELVSHQSARFEDISYRIGDDYLELSFTGTAVNSARMLPLLKQAIVDYLVNELMIQWLLIRYPAWSQPYIAMKSELLRSVKDLFASFCNKKIRRRPTNLAGI